MTQYIITCFSEVKRFIRISAEKMHVMKRKKEGKEGTERKEGKRKKKKN